MSALVNLSRDVYFYAQALDNSGETEYWMVSDRGERYHKLEPTDQRLRLIRRQIDEASAFQRQLPLQGRELDIRASLSGVSVLIVKPTTLDVDGRISPVVMLFNLYGGMRCQAVPALRAILEAMRRELSQSASSEIDKLHRMLTWPRPFLFFTLLFTKSWSKN